VDQIIEFPLDRRGQVALCCGNQLDTHPEIKPRTAEPTPEWK
jgi:hypothetical protein